MTETLEPTTETDERLVELQQAFDQASSELAEARKQLETIERRQRIDQELMGADAVDLETARLLTEVAVGVMEEPDVSEAVAELRRSKPFLFRRERGGGARAGAMAARPRLVGSAAQDAAESAAMSGDRRDLMRCLRLRRKGRGT